MGLSNCSNAGIDVNSKVHKSERQQARGPRESHQILMHFLFTVKEGQRKITLCGSRGLNGHSEAKRHGMGSRQHPYSLCSQHNVQLKMTERAIATPQNVNGIIE